MEVAVLGCAALRRLLPPGDCMDLAVEVLMGATAGEAGPLAEVVLPQPEGGPSASEGHGAALAAALVALAQPPVLAASVGSAPRGAGPASGALLLFDPVDHRLLAVLDRRAVADACGAAVSAVAARLLARQDAGEMALLGTGRRAAACLEALVEVRPVRRVRVWSRDVACGHAFAAEASRRHGLPVDVAGDAQAAVRGAELVCAAGAAGTAALRGDWLASGAHVDATCPTGDPAARLHGTVAARGRVFVDGIDRLRAASQDAPGAVQRPAGPSAPGAAAPARLGDLLQGRVRGRTSRDEVTVFAAGEAGALVVAAAHRALAAARPSAGPGDGAALRVEFAGPRRAGTAV